jgi:NitT/TauT family transport system permease protein
MTINKKNNKIKSESLPLWIRFLPLILFLFLWEFIARISDHGVFFYGSPLSVSKYIIRKVADGSLIVDSGVTLFEVIIGFLLGNLLGSILGLLFWYNQKISTVVRPYIIVIGAIPILAFAPIIIIWFGVGIFAKIVIVTLSTFVVATSQSFEGALQADPKFINLLKSFGASRFTIFRKVIIPSSLSWLFAGFKLNIGFAILGAFIGEFISAEAGLGHLIIQSMGLFNTPLVLAAVVMICIISYLLNFLLKLIQKWLMPWQVDIIEKISNGKNGIEIDEEYQND